MINVAFIGAGRIADLHQLGYRNHPDARLYAVCDTDPGRLEARKQQWNLEKPFTDYRTLLDDPAIGAVEVRTPCVWHVFVVAAAAAAGKHIACQKPMTTSLASADRMIAAAAKNAGKIFKVTEIYVTYPPIALAKKLIDDGAIGDIVGMRINYISGPEGGWNVEAKTLEQQVRIASRGFGLETFDHGHHEWATAWYLTGEAERVGAWVDTLNGIVDGPATVMWKGRGNKRYGIADFMFCPEMTIPSKYYSNDELYQVLGTKGVIHINRGTGDLYPLPTVSHFDGTNWTHYNDIESDWASGFVHSTRNFIAAIKGEAEPLLTPAQGREILRFALAIMQAAGERREVYLDEEHHRFPRLYAWRRTRAERKDCIVGPARQAQAQRTTGHAKYAAQAHDLTLALPNRFNAAAAGQWECSIALKLTGEAGTPDQTFGLAVRDGALEVLPNAYPADADLSLEVRAGTWAAILLGKKRIDMAIFQGQIRYEGKVEKALPLRNAFGL